METPKKENRGGKRAGAGRPASGKNYRVVSLSLSPRSVEILASVSNKSALVNQLLEEWARKA